MNVIFLSTLLFNNLELTTIDEENEVFVLNKNNIKILDDIMIKNQYRYLEDKNDKRVISERKIINDFSNNQFILYEFLPCGYSILNTLNYDIIESSSYSISPFLGYSGNLYYCTLGGYFQKQNDSYINLHNNAIIDNKKINLLSSKSNQIASSSKKNINEKNQKYLNINSFSEYLGAVDLDTNQNILTSDGGGSGSEVTTENADVEIVHSWFFKENDTEFASDHSFFDTGCCGYVALGLLLTYHEFFSSKGYFSDEEAQLYINNVNSNPNSRNAVPTINDSFIGYLCNTYSTSLQTTSFLKTLGELFTSGKDIGCSHNAPLIFTYSTVESLIRSNIPVIIAGHMDGSLGGWETNIWHDVVIYGCFTEEQKYLTHYGWDNCSQVILSDYTASFIYYIEHNSDHVHNRYYNYLGNDYCACGTLMWPSC